MVFLVGTASLFKEPIYFKTLGLHATEYGQVFLTTRFFENYVPRAKRSALRTNWTDLPLTTGSLGNLCMRMPAWMICFDNFAGWGHQQRNIGLVASCSPSFPPYWNDLLAPTWRQRLLSRGILAAQFEIWGQNGTTLKACKIVNFNPKHLKLWNCVFQTAYFKNMCEKNFAS